MKERPSSLRILAIAALLLAVLMAGSVQAAGASGTPPVRKSLVIALDGVRSDALQVADTPEIDRLLAGEFGGGAYRGAHAYSAQTIQDGPTSSAYNHCSIMTGVTRDKHGVDANNAEALAAVDYDLYPHYLTTLEAADPALDTAFLVTWGPDLSIESTADYAKDGEDASNVQRVVAILDGTHSDAAGDLGTSWPAGTDVDAIFLFLDDPDAAGHSTGFSPTSAPYIAALETADTQLGQIFAAIENRVSFAAEAWQIVITTDHGGDGLSHGPLKPNEETIPFIVVSRQVQQGPLAGRVHNYDVPPTVIAHMLGVGAIPAQYDGAVQGNLVLPAPPASILDGLVTYLAFEGDLADGSGSGNHATLGANSDHDPTLVAGGGLYGGYVQIDDLGGGADDASYLTLGTPGDLDVGTGVDFTLTAWLRADAKQTGDPPILGNKNWQSGANRGVALLADEGNGADFGLNLATSFADRKDVQAIDYDLGSWWFVAATVDRDGAAVLHVGSPDGVLFQISDFVDDVGDLDTALPWNIGQDATGAYAHNLAADLDEIALWRRALDRTEIGFLYNGGAGVDLSTIIDGTNSQPVARDDDADVDENASVAIDVLANDSDPNGDAVAIDGFTQGANGAVTAGPGTDLTYTPAGDFTGSDSFTYTVVDGRGGSDGATVTVRVGPRGGCGSVAAAPDAPLAMWLGLLALAVLRRRAQ